MAGKATILKQPGCIINAKGSNEEGHYYDKNLRATKRKTAIKIKSGEDIKNDLLKVLYRQGFFPWVQETEDAWLVSWR